MIKFKKDIDLFKYVHYAVIRDAIWIATTICNFGFCNLLLFQPPVNIVL